ncbi:GntR family transcriptional regulator [Vagococcus zengguangii]|uniref:GntR family transcriptional regulator n=2 Tax=Vagococcus zengguangii TaxID=2571750 RepID=A0A4D7CRV8_9ENTE|nr:GntR family transcriptional regulator [Vagococcus zengguangii]
MKAEEKVRLYIKQNIASQKFLPNMKLVEEDIAKELNISRSPVRAALKKLEKENVVRLIPNKGAYITPKQLSTKEFVDRMQMFELLLIHTLVGMEQWEYQFPADSVVFFESFNDKKEIDSQELNELQSTFFDFQKNAYLTDSFKTIIKEVLVYSETSSQFSLRELAILFTQLFLSLFEKVQTHQYAAARKQVRVFVNAISLDVIDNQEIHEEKYLF